MCPLFQATLSKSCVRHECGASRHSRLPKSCSPQRRKNHPRDRLLQLLGQEVLSPAQGNEHVVWGQRTTCLGNDWKPCLESRQSSSVKLVTQMPRSLRLVVWSPMLWAPCGWIARLCLLWLSPVWRKAQLWLELNSCTRLAKGTSHMNHFDTHPKNANAFLLCSFVGLDSD